MALIKALTGERWAVAPDVGPGTLETESDTLTAVAEAAAQTEVVAAVAAARFAVAMVVEAKMAVAAVTVALVAAEEVAEMP